MPNHAETANRSTTIDPEKWLGILQRWHPRMPRQELVDFINEFIEAAGLQRVEGLDALFVHVDKTTRSAQEKFDKLRQWTKKMRSDPRFWPPLFERERPVSVLIKKIVDEARRPVTRRDVERQFRKYRTVPSTGLGQELKELANRGEIDRLKLGVYWHRGTASAAYESDIQRMYRLVYSAPDHRLREAELAVILGLSRADTASRVSQLRKRGLFAPATGNGVVVVSAESLATLQRGPIFDGRGGIFFEVERAASPDGTVFTALRPERLPLEDAEVQAEIDRLKALPPAEYDVEREPASSRLGIRLSVLDRFRSDGAKEEVGTAIPQGAAAVTAVPPQAVMSRADRKAMREASLKSAEERYFRLIEAQPDRAPEAKSVLEKKMMDDFKVTRDEARYCRAKAIKRYSSLHPDNPCKWGEAGRYKESGEQSGEENLANSKS
jgi:hypothetical protein